MKLYGFLQNQPPLNPLLASFFSKVLSILIGRKPERVSWLEVREPDWKNGTHSKTKNSIKPKLVRMHKYSSEPDLVGGMTFYWPDKTVLTHKCI